MKERIIVAVITVPAIIIVLVFLPSFVLSGALAVICALMAYEFLLALMPVKGNIRLFIYAMISSATLPIGAYLGINSFVLPIVLLVLMSFVFIEAIIRFNTEKQYPLTYILAALFGGILIPYLFTTVLSLRLMEHGRLLVLIPIICAFTTDAGAYFTGVLFGKHKAFPNISPSKTIEGCIGGIAIGILSLMIYGVILAKFTSLGQINFAVLLIYGVIGSLICELGDLAFSLLKREFKIKDFGQLLPGHGGVLDRFDSMIFTAPAIYLMIVLFPPF